MDSAVLGILLAFASALTLAAANVSIKMGGDILTGRALLSLSAALFVFPAAFLVPAPDGGTWGALALSIPAHFAYQICMIRALGKGDLSLVFPVMRGLAPLLTAMVAVLLLSESLSPTGWVGLAVATVAVVSFVSPPTGVLLRQHPQRSALLWAAATAIGIAVYNGVDARGVRLAPDPLTYLTWLFLLDAIPITIAAIVLRRRVLAETVALKWRYGMAAGAMSVMSFGAALYAMSLIEVARVSAIRETAVVFAAFMGGLILREPLGRRRLASALVLSAGLLIMQLG